MEFVPEMPPADLEEDRRRLASYLSGEPGVEHAVAKEWLLALARGERCPAPCRKADAAK